MTISKLLSIITNSADCWGDHDGNFEASAEYLYVGGTPVSGSNPVVWIPFDNIPIARNKTITSAVIYWTAYVTGTGTAQFNLGCEAADNPSAPTNNAQLLARTMTSAFSVINPVSYIGGTQYNYTVTASVQEIINRAGWAAGNRLAILITDVVQGNTNRRPISSYEYPTYTRPTLQILVDTDEPRVGGFF